MYIIRSTCIATEKNENHKGEVHIWHTGKGGTFLCNVNEEPAPSNIELFGYKTLAGAKRGLKVETELAEKETARGNWIETAEIIEC